MDLIRNCLVPFKKISLADLESVALMDRVDVKYCLHINQLPSILDELRTHYYSLEINGESVFNYDNTYFDTVDNEMYLSHQNGKRDRFKIRIRAYTDSNIYFLEIKHKNNKGRTIKDRIEKEEFKPEFTHEEQIFLENIIPFDGYQLEPKINSYFKRITLVNDDFTERATIDLCPGFKNQEKEVTLNNLVIIEIKQDIPDAYSPIIKILKNHRISRNGISKYCIGRSMLEEHIKNNNFKPLQLYIKKHYSN